MSKDPFAPINPDCTTCRFWEAYERTDDGRPSAGLCRRYAPRPEFITVLWPETYVGDWCGEWSEAIDR